MRWLLWAAPFAFGYAFFAGYLDDSRHPGAAAVIAFILVALAAGGAGFAPLAASHRIWATANLLAAAICAWGMWDNAFHHNSYSGFGALLLAPVAAAAALSMLALAFAAGR